MQMLEYPSAHLLKYIYAWTNGQYSEDDISKYNGG